MLCAADAAGDTAAIAADQLSAATNMTDELSALGCLVGLDCPHRQPAIDAFEVKWSQDELGAIYSLMFVELHARNASSFCAICTF